MTATINCATRHRAGARFRPALPSQSGQALIFGLFALVGGIVALFFLFNTGQLITEKTKLVNTADAVAYSAGVMHVRALNFASYTNRALVANEVLIAQAVSMSSWTNYVSTHAQNAPMLMWCQSQYSKPVALVLITYIPVCYVLSYPAGAASAQMLDQAVPPASQATVAAAELAKQALQAAQANMAASLVPARALLMQEVAAANYANDGLVHVDSIPLTDNFTLFNGGPFIKRYSGSDRGRFKQTTLAAADLDRFIKQRAWTSSNPFPCIFGNKAEFRRRGGTELIGFDEWRAMDTASLHEWEWKIHWFSASCDESETPLGYGAQGAGNGNGGGDNGFGGSRSDNGNASSYASSSTWQYSGLPSFFDLSEAALNSQEDSPPLLRFSIRLTRAKNEARTSEGSSGVKPSGRLARFDSNLASDVLAAVSTSEVFFRRTPRNDGRTELASLFNPYWQVHLISTSSADIAQAIARGGPQ
jgi:hypothetical protein